MTHQVETRPGVPMSVPRPVRPGLITFSSVMMYVLAGFLTIAAISEWSNSVWLYQRDFEVAGSRLVFWGFVDIALALLSAYTAYLLWEGRRGGQILGFLFAGISFVRWLFYIPADPWLAFAILIIDGIVIYALAAHDDWFRSMET